MAMFIITLFSLYNHFSNTSAIFQPIAAQAAALSSLERGGELRATLAAAVGGKGIVA